MNKRITKALYIAYKGGNPDEAHHKQYIIDQMIRALTGCDEDNETEEYKEWVGHFEDGEDGPNTWEWDTGIAP